MFKKIHIDHGKSNIDSYSFLLEDSCFNDLVELKVDIRSRRAIYIDYCLPALIKYYRTIPVSVSKTIAAYYASWLLELMRNENTRSFIKEYTQSIFVNGKKILIDIFLN